MLYLDHENMFVVVGIIIYLLTYAICVLLLSVV